MQSLSKAAYLVSLVLLAATACQQDNTDNSVDPVQSKTINNLAADPVTINPQTGQATGGTGKYTLFSFKDGAQVSNNDSASNKWDIGFRGTNIIINGGPIRSGQGGAAVYTGTFDQLTSIPENTTFALDQTPSQLAIPTGSSNGWYNYNPATMVITPIPGRVLLIRTADGKYAKMEILNYYKDSPTQPTIASEGRYYTFRYIYQPNGSKSFN